MAKPEWWNDEGLKALSARVVRAAPSNEPANQMRAEVLRGECGAWEAGPRSAAELREAAAHYERAAALTNVSVMKAEYAVVAVGRVPAVPVAVGQCSCGSCSRITVRFLTPLQTWVGAARSSHEPARARSPQIYRPLGLRYVPHHCRRRPNRAHYPPAAAPPPYVSRLVLNAAAAPLFF